MPCHKFLTRNSCLAQTNTSDNGNATGEGNDSKNDFMVKVTKVEES